MNGDPLVEPSGMSEERMRILRMLRANKITAEDAAQLLDALEGSRPSAPGPATPPPSPAEEIKRVVDDVVRNIPRDSLDDLGDIIRDSVRDALHGSRDVARAWRHVGRSGFGQHLVDAVLSGGAEATAPFEDVRVTTATRLQFRNTRGDVRLVLSPDGRLHVKARRRVRAADVRESERIAERVPIEVYEREGTVVVEGPGARPFHERIRVDFDIALPAQMHLDAAVVRGDTNVEYPAGDVTVSTVKGDVTIADCARAVVRSTSGAVAIHRCKGDVTVDVTRGDVAVARAEGDIAVSSKRGDVSVRAGTVRSLRAQTYRGDIILHLNTFVAGGAGVINTLHGDVTVRLNPAARCRIEASTLHGDLDSALPLGDLSSDRRRLTGVLNAPDTHLRISSSHGDIVLRPATVETEARD